MLLALVILAFFSHIAPLPFSVHTPFTTSAESHEPSGIGPEASHIASCDAMTSRTAPVVGAPGATVAMSAGSLFVVPCTPPMATLGVATRSSRHPTSAPLFLLYASLLI
jgi:hypothetical protein